MPKGQLEKAKRDFLQEVQPSLTPEQKLEIIRAVQEDKKAQDITILDLRGKTLIADYFIICSGNSRIHIRAIADGIIEKMKSLGIKGISPEGYEAATWIVLDYGDVVVHIFAQQERELYRLEDLWQARGPVMVSTREF